MKTITADEVCKTFYDIVIARHGCPSFLVSDQGSQFTSAKHVIDLINEEEVEIDHASVEYDLKKKTYLIKG